MLNIPFLANDIKCAKVCYVYIFQHTHIVAYDAYAYTPKKFSSKCEENCTQMGKRKTPGAYVKAETSTQNITEKNMKEEVLKDYREQLKRWWYINSRRRPPPKHNP